MFFLIALLLADVYSVAEADLKSCSALLPDKGIPEIPNQQQLVVVCPSILSFIECYKKEIRNNPEDFDDDNRIFHPHLDRLIHDLCNDTSRIRKDYKESIECFKNVKNKFNPCLDAAESVYREYKKSTTIDIKIDETPYTEKDCFTRGHAVGCMSNEILNTCNTLQLATYTELVQRSRYLGKFCDSSTAEELRTNYLNYLNLDDSLRDMYRLAFDYQD